FRALQDAGHIEIITSAATHAYLPLALTDTSVRAQIRTGVDVYRQHFDRSPRGFWLPECGYRPGYAWSAPLPEFQGPAPVRRAGVGQLLAESGIEYTFVDRQTLLGQHSYGVYADRFPALKELWARSQAAHPNDSSKRTTFSTYRLEEGDKGITVFGRDERTGAQVWSSDLGYPGDAAYLEFHRKHFPGRLRYWSVSMNKADMGAKPLYQPYLASQQVRAHANHFSTLVASELQRYRSESGQPGVIAALYDAELFGHWWFEGVDWLYEVIREIHRRGEVHLSTCEDYSNAHAARQLVSLPEGSWGEGGYHGIWLNEETGWTWALVYNAERTMAELGRLRGGETLRTVLDQAVRELMLLQSSDWQFSITTWTSRDYAQGRVIHHSDRFNALAEMARSIAAGRELYDSDSSLLAETILRDRCFRDPHSELWHVTSNHATPPKPEK
ncbi:MAG TPA: 1,4-alpha-glucan branching protein domain-containing protein, partial [Chthonomonadales bacterium]|nr:1,4-alpha-glucan branching protein domain-containing protein [Chthonomonadales bacterium]